MNYNKFYNQKFQESLVKGLSLTSTWNNDISNLIDVCAWSLDKHAPLKKKYTCVNHLPFMNKELPKAIMQRSKLHNTFLRSRCNENRKKVFETMELLCLFVEKNKKIIAAVLMRKTLQIINHCTKKWSFPLRISSVNVTKTAGNWGFRMSLKGHCFLPWFLVKCSQNLT